MSVDLSLRADLSALRSELAKIPGLSEAEAKKMVRTLSTNFKAAEKAAKSSAKSIEKEMAGALGDIEQGANVALGPIVGDVLDIGKAFGGLATAIGPTGVALVAVGGAAAVGVAGLALLESAALSSVNALDELGVPVDPKMQASIERANAAMSALGAGFDQVIVTVGAKFAPLVEQSAELLLHLGYKAADAIAAFGDGQVTLESFAKFLTSTFMDALLSPIRTIALFGLSVAELGDAVGLNTKNLRRGADQVMSWAQAQEDAVVGMVELDGVLANIDPRVRQLTAATLRQVEARNKDTKATKHQTDANREYEAALGRMGSLMDQVSAIQREAADDQLDDVGRLVDGANRQVEALERVRVEYENLAERGIFVSAELTKVDEAQAAVKARLVRDVEALSQVSDELTEAFKKNKEAGNAAGEGLQAWVEKNQKWFDLAGQIAQATADLVGSATDAAIVHAQKLEDRAAAARDAAISAYDAAKKKFDENQSSMSDTERAAASAKLALLRGESEATSAHYRKVRKEQREAAMEAYKAQKAAAITNVWIQAAVSTMALIPSLAYLAWGAPIAAAGLSAAAAIASTVAINKAPPPKFHTGGVVDAPWQPQPGEVDARLTVGEGVLTRRGVESVGGKDGVAALNRGQGRQDRATDSTSVFFSGRLQAQLFAGGRQILHGAPPVIGSRYGMG